MKIIKKKKDKLEIIFEALTSLFGIILGTLMIVGTFLPYMTYGENEVRLIGTSYGTIVIVGGIITIILGIFSSRIRAGYLGYFVSGFGYLVSGTVSFLGNDASIYHSGILKKYIDLDSLINKEAGFYVILFSSFFTILTGLYAINKIIDEAMYEDCEEKKGKFGIILKDLLKNKEHKEI
ncbi:MAG: hypothetical protein K6B41_11080 [Butyrivibrio sp.]|nr:hypothetical protein [Butyrivibrio sp.]